MLVEADSSFKRQSQASLLALLPCSLFQDDHHLNVLPTVCPGVAATQCSVTTGRATAGIVPLSNMTQCHVYNDDDDDDDDVVL